MKRRRKKRRKKKRKKKKKSKMSLTLCDVINRTEIIELDVVFSRTEDV